MALKTLVKVGSITNLSDARYCAGMGVDFLGFRVIEGQEKMITSKTFQEIRGWVAGPQIVAEIFGIKEKQQLAEIIENFRPDYFELSISDLEVVGSLFDIPYILTLEPGEFLPPFASNPAYIIVDPETVSLTKLIPEYDILAKVSSLQDLHKALDHTGVSGIALQGSQEMRPGLKTYDEMAEILEALEQE